MPTSNPRTFVETIKKHSGTMGYYFFLIPSHLSFIIQKPLGLGSTNKTPTPEGSPAQQKPASRAQIPKTLDPGQVMDDIGIHRMKYRTALGFLLLRRDTITKATLEKKNI